MQETKGDADISRDGTSQEAGVNYSQVADFKALCRIINTVHAKNPPVGTQVLPRDL
jgi:hypothetical protein